MDMDMYWTNTRLNDEINKEISSTSRSLFLAHAEPYTLDFKTKVKWLVELKLRSIKENHCWYCLINKNNCDCLHYCSKCKEKHNGYQCQKHIMNTALIRFIIQSIQNNNKC